MSKGSSNARPQTAACIRFSLASNGCAESTTFWFQRFDPRALKKPATPLILPAAHFFDYLLHRADYDFWYLKRHGVGRVLHDYLPPPCR